MYSRVLQAMCYVLQVHATQNVIQRLGFVRMHVLERQALHVHKKGETICRNLTILIWISKRRREMQTELNRELQAPLHVPRVHVGQPVKGRQHCCPTVALEAPSAHWAAAAK